MIEPANANLPIGKQCKLLSISRPSFYYQPNGETGPGSVAAPRLVEDGDVRGDLAVDQPAKHRRGAIGGVCDQALRVEVEPGLHALEHGLLVDPTSAWRIDLVVSTSMMTPWSVSIR